MRRRFKIAMVAACPFPCPRGTPTRIFRMAEALSSKGHQVHVVTYHLGDRLDEVPFAIHRIRATKSYQRYSPGPTYRKLALLDPLLLFKLLDVLKTNDIDIIHAHHYEGLLVSLLARKWTGHPVVYDAHTLLESELPYYQLMLPDVVKRRIGRYMDLSLPRKAAHVVSVSEDIRTNLVEAGGVVPQNITVVKNGVENERFQVEPNGVKPNLGATKVLVYAGNFAPYQRVDLLLKSFKAILDQGEDVRLQLISDSSFDEHEPLARQLGVLGNIDISRAGFEALPENLARADIALNTRTDCAGTPLKLLNYMAAGKPIVSFAGSAQILEHGKTGLVVGGESTCAFSRAVVQLLRDPELAARLGANAMKHVSAEYTWESAAAMVEVVYQDILSCGRTESCLA